jgi:arginase family enzyme
MEDIYATGSLRALDVVEVNPDLSDEAGSAKTIEAAKRLIYGTFGGYRGGLPTIH